MLKETIQIRGKTSWYQGTFSHSRIIILLSNVTKITHTDAKLLPQLFPKQGIFIIIRFWIDDYVELRIWVMKWLDECLIKLKFIMRHY